MTENEFIHIVPQLRQIALQSSQGYGVGCEEAEGHRDRYIGSLFRTSEPVNMIPSS